MSFDELMGVIAEKCEKFCGMRKAWPDGLCHADESMCNLAPHSPLWAPRAKAVSSVVEVYEDL